MLFYLLFYNIVTVTEESRQFYMFNKANLTTQIRDGSNPNACGTFECEACGKIYKYKTGLSRHQRFECGKEPQFKCPYCSKRSHQKGTLKSHVYSKHFDILKCRMSTKF